MKKFEYKVVYYSLTDQELNIFGGEGWELVSVTEQLIGGRGHERYYFKRDITYEN